MDVILGAHNVGYEEPSQQTFKIINLKVHGLYHGLRKPKHLHDIAIITLDREAELNDKVQIAKISNSTKWNSKDVSMTVIGWGLTRDDGFKSYVLREVGVPIKKIDECEPIYKLRFPSESYICAKPENGKDSCQVSGKHQQLAKSSGLINQFTYRKFLIRSRASIKFHQIFAQNLLSKNCVLLKASIRGRLLFEGGF